MRMLLLYWVSYLVYTTTQGFPLDTETSITFAWRSSEPGTNYFMTQELISLTLILFKADKNELWKTNKQKFKTLIVKLLSTIHTIELTQQN